MSVVLDMVGRVITENKVGSELVDRTSLLSNREVIANVNEKLRAVRC